MLLRFKIQDVLNRQMDRFPIDLDGIGFAQRLQMLQAQKQAFFQFKSLEKFMK